MLDPELNPKLNPNLCLDYHLSAYDYELPSDRIAQDPVVPRDNSRLLAVDSSRKIHHCHFHQLPQLLRAGDLLVLNDTQVIPARLYGRKPSGLNVEILLIEPRDVNCWLALVKPGKRLPIGSEIIFADGVQAVVLGKDEVTRGSILQFKIEGDRTMTEVITALGQVPLPPYIKDSQASPEQYQTVYAAQQGAVAAPTAGLHFTDRLLTELTDMGIAQAYITLHVGVGTFRPVETEDITQHVMHQEWLEISEQAIAAIKTTKANGGRVIGVGTTVARTLESSKLEPMRGKTDLMIYPGYEWQVLDGLITNFHLPKSSLMMLVASFLGDRKLLLELYAEAIAQQYRFYSFGDAMLILP
jgi:S-adenosylmethionine:tRNA ribosyltransferase-isomerase